MGYVSLFPGCRWYGVSVVFDPAAFKILYPQWAALPDAQLQGYFDIATLFLRNDGTGPAATAAVQTNLLNLLTAHITWLSAGADGTGAAAIVGRISSASEGSVSVSADFPSTPNNAWFMQTPFGAMFWQATAAYRMTRYIPGRPRFGNGISQNYFPGGRRW